MKQILLLEKSKLASLIHMHLSKNENVNVVSKTSADEIISLADLLGNIELIICEKDHLAQIQKGHEFIKFYVIDPFIEVEKNIAEIGKIIGTEVVAKAADTGVITYKAISINYFESIKKLAVNCDLYIKIRKGTSDQYLKRLNADEVFTEEEIKKYIQSGLQEFYVPTAKYELVANTIINILTGELSKKTNSFEDQKNLEQNTYHISLERLKTVGIDAFTVQLVDETMNSINKSISEKGILGKFLKHLASNKASFSYAVSYLTCLTMTSLLKTFEWDTPAIKEQVTMASFFHNIALESDDEIKIFTAEDLNNSALSADRKKEIKLHALTSSGIVAEFPRISPVVITMIKEHHGSSSGVDFPAAPGPSLHPMSKCFMVCESFAAQIVELGPNVTKSSLDNVMNNLKKNFPSPSYAQFVTAIERMTSG